MDEIRSAYDVVVVGSGAGGLAAALTASICGLSVVVCEKSHLIGGSTAVSGGSVWIPQNPLMKSAGHDDSRESVMSYLAAMLGNHMNQANIAAFIDQGPKMVDFFARNTEVVFEARKYSPDYESERAGASMGGRTIDPKPFDARRLGENFKRLRPPLRAYTALGGMMVNRGDVEALLAPFSSLARLSSVTRLLSRYAIDRLRYHRGTRLVLGNALAARLLKSTIDRHIPIATQAAIDRLLVQEGRVTGVRLAIEGKSRTIEALRGVVLATGGFPANAELRARYFPAASQHRSVPPAANVGDGIRLALEAGAVLTADNKGAGLWTPVSVREKGDGSEEIFPHLVLDRQRPGFIAVDGDGRRFVNEAVSYHAFVEAMHRNPVAIPAFAIFDAAYLSRYGFGFARPRTRPDRYVSEGYLVRAGTIGELAGKIGVSQQELTAAVDGMNVAAETGVDPAFGKGSSRYNRYLGDNDHKPNPCLGAIATPPFYSVKLWPGNIGTATGLVVDPCARVLNSFGEPIVGLFACGNDMNSIMAGAYPAAGITLGPALTFGYIAGSSLAEQT